MKTTLILTIVASFVTTALYAFDPPPVGGAAPDFSLTDAKEKPILSQLRQIWCSNGSIRNARS
jgi:hypothetical protein